MTKLTKDNTHLLDKVKEKLQNIKYELEGAAIAAALTPATGKDGVDDAIQGSLDSISTDLDHAIDSIESAMESVDDAKTEALYGEEDEA